MPSKFTKWATTTLKHYLVDDYSLNENRLLAIQDNVINLNNDLYDVLKRLGILEKYVFVGSKVIFNGTIFDASVLVNQLVEPANESLILIDSYSNIYTLNDLKNKKKDVSLLIITSERKSRLSTTDIDNFNEQYGGLTVEYDETIHDRFLIIDKTIFYHLGSSIDYLGKRLAEIEREVDDETINDIKQIFDK